MTFLPFLHECEHGCIIFGFSGSRNEKEHDTAKGMTTDMEDDRLLRWTCTLWNQVIDVWQRHVCSITFSTWAWVYI
jgi:hypothetical protein